MTWLKRIVLSLISLFLLLIIALVIFLNTFDPNHYKQAINQALSKAMGHQSQIKGKINWQYFPAIGIQLNNIVIKNKQDILANIKQLQGSLRLAPLLHKQFIVKNLSMNNARFHLKIDKNGNNNWQTAKKNNKAPKKPKKNDPSTLSQFQIDRVRINDAELLINEPLKQTKLTHFIFNSKNIAFDKRFPFSIKGQLAIKSKEALTVAPIKLNGTLIVNSQRLQSNTPLKALTFEGAFISKNIRHNKVKIDRFDSQLSLKNAIASFKLNKLLTYQGNIKGQVRYNTTNAHLNLNTTVSHVNIGQLLKDLNNTRLLNGQLNASITLATYGNTKDERIQKLNGQAKVSITKGALKRVDIWGLTNWLKKLFKKKNLSVETWIKQAKNQIRKRQFNKGDTPFKTMKANFTIKNGIIKTNALVMKSKRLKIKGHGKVSLISQRLNFQLNAAYDRKSANDITLLPLQLKGPIKKPTIMPNMAFISKKLKRLFIDQTKLKIKKLLQ